MKPIENIDATLSYRDVVDILRLVRSALRYRSVDVQLGDLRVRVERAEHRGTGASAPATESAAADHSTAGSAAEPTTTVLAPSLGIFRRALAPDGTTLARAGRRVSAADPIGAIEVMRQATEVQAGAAGEIVEVLVEDSEFVEYGQPLVRIRAG